MASKEFYGSGRAWGLLFDASAIYKIDKSWFVRGAIEWRRVEIDYEGTGKAQLDMTDPMPIAAVVDGCVRVAVNIGGSY
jgi:hypothetical protein